MLTLFIACAHHVCLRVETSVGKYENLIVLYTYVDILFLNFPYQRQTQLPSSIMLVHDLMRVQKFWYARIFDLHTLPTIDPNKLKIKHSQTTSHDRYPKHTRTPTVRLNF